MQLRHVQTVVAPAEGAAKVTALAYSPNGVKLALCTVDRVRFVVDILVPRFAAPGRGGRDREETRGKESEATEKTMGRE